MGASNLLGLSSDLTPTYLPCHINRRGFPPVILHLLFSFIVFLAFTELQIIFIHIYLLPYSRMFMVCFFPPPGEIVRAETQPVFVAAVSQGPGLPWSSSQQAFNKQHYSSYSSQSSTQTSLKGRTEINSLLCDHHPHLDCPWLYVSVFAEMARTSVMVVQNIQRFLSDHFKRMEFLQILQRK